MEFRHIKYKILSNVMHGKGENESHSSRSTVLEL